MTLLVFIAFVGLLAGCFLLLKLSPIDFYKTVCKWLVCRIKPVFNRKKPIARRIQEIKAPKKPKGIRKTVGDAKEVLALTGKIGKFGRLCATSFLLFAIGVFVSILMGNSFMIPVAAVGMALLPFWYVIFSSHSYQKQMNGELETALSIITTSYLRNESILLAVEENLNYINPPVTDVFRAFLAESKLISVNVKQALEAMKPKLNSEVFHEWVDAVISCQEDRTLKSTLTPIISKLSDMRVVSAELDYMMYDPLKEFITMALLLVSNIPLIYFLNRDWFGILVGTGFGKAILAICAFVTFISLAAVMRLTKPVEYRR